MEISEKALKAAEQYTTMHDLNIMATTAQHMLANTASVREMREWAEVIVAAHERGLALRGLTTWRGGMIDHDGTPLVEDAS